MANMPKFNEILYPILDWIQDGTEYNVKDISDKIRDKYFDLSEEQKNERVTNGYTRFHDRLMWARTYLSKAGLVSNTRRGFIKITDRGLQILKSKFGQKGITLDDLAQYEDFLEFKNGKKYGGESVEIIETSFETPQDKIDFGFNEIDRLL